MNIVERELTYLAKYLPVDIADFPSKELLDIYIPSSAEHPVLRIRKNGVKYEMTKKQPVKEGDASVQTENTIKLTREEFDELSELLGKRIRKIRYNYIDNGHTAEIDVFQDELEGLVLVDFEFSNSEGKEAFTMPDFCLVEVTQKKFTAGGVLSGKTYEDIAYHLETLGYKRIR